MREAPPLGWCVKYGAGSANSGSSSSGGCAARLSFWWRVDLPVLSSPSNTTSDLGRTWNGNRISGTSLLVDGPTARHLCSGDGPTVGALARRGVRPVLLLALLALLGLGLRGRLVLVVVVVVVVVLVVVLVLVLVLVVVVVVVV